MQNSFTNVNSHKCICGIYNSLKLQKKNDYLTQFP